MTSPEAAALRRDWVSKHLAQEPLQFVLDGRTYELVDVTARVWLRSMMSTDNADLLLNLLSEGDAQDLWDDVTDPDVDLDAALLQRIGREMARKATGRPWGQLVQLVAHFMHFWPTLDGRLADRGGGDPLDWSLERLCNWTYFTMVDGLDKKQRDQVDQRLNTPVVDDVDVPDDDEDAVDDGVAAAWMAMVATGQVGALPEEGQA